MLRPRIMITSFPEQMGRAAADILQDLISRKPSCVIGLATGSTPIPLYRELVRRALNGELCFGQVRTVNLDEYKGLSAAHPQSFAHFMDVNLFRHITMPPENHIIFDGLSDEPDAMFCAYEQQIEEWGGIDLQILGIGHDGHIGFNEPGSCFEKHCHEVCLTENTRLANQRFFNGLAEVPKAAFTMGIGTIMAARAILLLATGEDKAEILAKALSGPITPIVPASILQLHPNVTVVCDIAAYSKMKG